MSDAQSWNNTKELCSTIQLGAGAICAVVVFATVVLGATNLASRCKCSEPAKNTEVEIVKLKMTTTRIERQLDYANENISDAFQQIWKIEDHIGMEDKE